MGMSPAEVEDAGLSERLRGQSGEAPGEQDVPDKFGFTAVVRPVGKQRPRAGADGTFYTPTKTAEFEDYVAAQAKLERPKGWDQSGIYEVKIRVVYDGRQHSDLDNVVKSVLDALNGIAYNDDSQVHRISSALDLDASDSGTVVQVKRL